jgi:asparagine synthase (glutamine-hydrolysing)
MLWTTPESLQEKLPLQRGRRVITADARIDNREELISAVGWSGYLAHEITDSELILAAYVKWGEQCPGRLLGDFAFAIWDEDQEHLFCARDAFGVKPFYYFASPQTFIFASEIKGLLCLPEVPAQINDAKIADYLLQIYADGTTTFYQAISRLPAAHSLVASSTGVHVQQYWALNPSQELRLESSEEYAEAYREIFTESVRCRFRSAFPVGSMLSGGLDSSSIVCTARNFSNQPIQTYSIIFDAVPESDERPFIDEVLAGGGVEPHFIVGDRLPLLREREHSLSTQDEPFDAPNMFLNRGVWAVAQQQGVRMLFDGLLGDNVVSHGFTYLNELAYTGHWLTLAQEMYALTQRRQCSVWEPLWRYLWNYGIKPRIPSPMWRIWRQLRGYPASTVRVPAFIQPEFAQRLALVERLQQAEAAQSSIGKTAREVHYQDLTGGFIPAAMEIFNKGIAAFSMEACLPFTDRRLAEFCLAVPPNQKLHQGLSRMIVRRALANCLPEKIQWRDSKGDLGFNFIQTLKAESDYLDSVLRAVPTWVGQYINVTPLQTISQRLQSESHSVDDDMIQQLLLAVTLTQWFQSQDGRSLQPACAPAEITDS